MTQNCIPKWYLFAELTDLQHILVLDNQKIPWLRQQGLESIKTRTEIQEGSGGPWPPQKFSVVAVVYMLFFHHLSIAEHLINTLCSYYVSFTLLPAISPGVFFGNAYNFHPKVNPHLYSQFASVKQESASF